jgi:hypothetical protein
MKTPVLLALALLCSSCGNDEKKKKDNTGIPGLAGSAPASANTTTKVGSVQIIENEPQFKGTSVIGYTQDSGGKASFMIMIDDGTITQVLEKAKNIKYECRAERKSEPTPTTLPSDPKPTAVRDCTSLMFVVINNSPLPTKTTYAYDIAKDESKSGDESDGEISSMCGGLIGFTTQATFATLPKKIGDEFKLDLNAGFYKFDISAILNGGAAAGSPNLKKFRATMTGKVIEPPGANLPKCPEGQEPYPVGI